MEVNKWRRTGNPATSLPHGDVELRNVIPRRISNVFFENQCDPEGNYMAAFTAKDPSDRAGFQSFWPAASYAINTGGEGSVSDWIGKRFLGPGIATDALSQ
jgi:hypothetical protein